MGGRDDIGNGSREREILSDPILGLSSKVDRAGGGATFSLSEC